MGKSLYLLLEKGGESPIVQSPGQAVLAPTVTGIVTQWKGLKAKGPDLESHVDPTEISTFGV